MGTTSNDDEILPDPEPDPAHARRFNELLALYPRELAVKQVAEYYASLPPDDSVMLPGMSEEELEHRLAEDFGDLKDAPPEALAEFEQMKRFFRETRGKKLSELPVTPEEDAASNAEEAETAILNVHASWLNALHYAHRQQAADGTMRLTDDLEPAAEVAWDPLHFPGIASWHELPCNSIAMSPDQVRTLHAEFAARLRPLIDAQPEGLRLTTEHVLRKDAQGYCLIARA